jgi:hypothetical protein
MTLKQQIEATIAAYQEACKPENLNLKYCELNDLESGLCLYLLMKNYFVLNRYINKDCQNQYITKTPFHIEHNESIPLGANIYAIPECFTILEAHQIRLKYLQNLLTQINL